MDVNGPDDLEAAVRGAASEAHKALWRLAHCGAWGLSDREAHQFAEEAETALAALLDPAADAEEG